MGRQVTQFQGADTEVIEAFDMLLTVINKLDLITYECNMNSWKIAYTRFEQNYKPRR